MRNCYLTLPWVTTVHFFAGRLFTTLNDQLLQSFAIVNDRIRYTIVIRTEKYGRNTEPCNTVQYTRKRPVCGRIWPVYVWKLLYTEFITLDLGTNMEKNEKTYSQ